MRKIEVELYNHGSYVCGRVKSMPEELRDVETIIAEGDFVLSGLACPRLRKNKLNLRGGLRQYDTEWFNFDYPNEEEARKAIEAFESLIKKWNVLHQDVLSEKEKEYLSAVIKPYMNSQYDIYIRKFPAEPEDKKYEVITIRILQGKKWVGILDFPPFEKNTRYELMKIGKDYTPKELEIEIEEK